MIQYIQIKETKLKKLIHFYFLYILCVYFLFSKIVFIAHKRRCLSCLTDLISYVEFENSEVKYSWKASYEGLGL